MLIHGLVKRPLVFTLAALYLVWSLKRHPGREERVYTRDIDTDIFGDSPDTLKAESERLDALAERGYYNEALDQILVEVLLGVR